MRYKSSKRVRTMSAVRWVMVGVAIGIVLACVIITVQVNNNLMELNI